MTDLRGALATSRTKKGSAMENTQRRPVNDEADRKPTRKTKATTTTQMWRNHATAPRHRKRCPNSLMTRGMHIKTMGCSPSIGMAKQ